MHWPSNCWRTFFKSFHDVFHRTCKSSYTNIFLNGHWNNSAISIDGPFLAQLNKATGTISWCRQLSVMESRITHRSTAYWTAFSDYHQKKHPSFAFLLNITFIFDRCRSSSAAVTPVNFDWDLKYVTGCKIEYFAYGENGRSFSNPHPRPLW